MSLRKFDRAFLITAKVASFAAVASLLFIIFFLVKESMLLMSQQNLHQVVTDPNWYPSENEFLLLPMITGSLFMMVGAMFLALPIGLLTAILCKYYAPRWISYGMQRIVEILSGIPAVVFGFWGVMVIVPLLANYQAPGTSLLAGILVLTLIVMPGIMIIMYHNLSQVNNTLIYNAIALGLTRFNIIRYIIYPEVKHGLLTGITLQSGRAIGETLAVLMVCGNVVQIPGSLFDPVRTLTSNIALEMAYAMDTHRSALFVSGLMLLVIVLLFAYLTDYSQKRNEAR